MTELLKRLGPTQFTGYDGVTGSSKVVGLVVDGQEVESISAPQQALVLLDATPFYAESGGQIGDRGDLSGPMGVFQVKYAPPTQRVDCSLWTTHRGLYAYR